MKAEVTISRASGNDGDNIRIKIQDHNSRIEFVEVALSLEAFAAAITGQAYQEADLKVRGLANVGKFRVTEKRRATYPIRSYDKPTLQAWLHSNCQEDGWLINDHLGSQSSIAWDGDKTVLNYSVTKFVEQEPKQ